MAFLGVHDPWLLWLTMAGIGIGAAVAAWMVLRMLGRVTAQTEGTFDDQFSKAIRGPVAIFVGLMSAVFVAVLLRSRLTDEQTLLTRNALLGLFVIAFASVAVGLLRILLEMAGRRKERYRPAAAVTRRLVAVLVYAGAFLVVLDQFGIAITPLLTGLGIAGLAAALALQDVLGNFFAGLSIQTGRAMQPGHYVRVEGEGGIEGYVEEIGWRTTAIRTLSGNTEVIPNSVLAQARVTDFYLPAKDMSVVMSFRTGMEADPKRVIEALVEEAKAAYKANPDMFKTDSAPFAQFSSIDDYSQNYSLIVRIPEFVQQWNAQQAVYLRVLERFRKDGVRIPYPTRHNFSEAVKPEATRVPGAPGGLAPHKRPPRPKRKPDDEEGDPRIKEAEKARTEIAAKQDKKERESKV